MIDFGLANPNLNSNDID